MDMIPSNPSTPMTEDEFRQAFAAELRRQRSLVDEIRSLIDNRLPAETGGDR